MPLAHAPLAELGTAGIRTELDAGAEEHGRAGL